MAVDKDTFETGKNIRIWCYYGQQTVTITRSSNQFTIACKDFPREQDGFNELLANACRQLSDELVVNDPEYIHIVEETSIDKRCIINKVLIDGNTYVFSLPTKQGPISSMIFEVVILENPEITPKNLDRLHSTIASYLARYFITNGEA